MKRKMISLLLVLGMTIIAAIPAAASAQQPSNEIYHETTSTVNSVDFDNVLQVTRRKIQADGFEVEATSVKLLKAFDGSAYTLIECAPTGYYILDNQSGTYVEYSGYAPSPYLGQYGDLYYGGPTYYYVKDTNEFSHTIVKAEVLSFDEQVQLGVVSKRMNQSLSRSKNDKMLAVISGLEDASVITFAKASPAYVPNGSFFRNATDNFGYVEVAYTNGICGYIAANLILQYWQHCGKFDLGYSQEELGNGTLSLELYQVGRDEEFSSGTWAAQISEVINVYCSKKNLPRAAAWGIGVYDVIGEINRGRPSILFGSIDSPVTATNHAVTMYGYTKASESSQSGSYIVHYGWPNYAEIVIGSAMIGSNTCYRMEV